MTVGLKSAVRRSRMSAVAVSIASLALLGGLFVAVPAQASTPQSVAAASPSDGVKAADLSKFNPGNIISDAVFYNSSTMSESQIQSFLDSKVSSCAAGYTCLKSKTDSTRAIGADAMCGAYAGGGVESSARIIYKVSQACGINPQAIIVMLEKEQGLVRHTSPSNERYRAAMGQGCPDTAACDARYYGFFNQVYGAAWQLKRYGNPTGTSNYFSWFPVGGASNIQFHPNTGCGTSRVTIENKATAALYYYTPYQPNRAAINAGYGTGDSCSAYGNRNFYQYFTDWFGSTQTSAADRSPLGGYDLVVSRGAITVQGWALDPDAPTTALDISVTVGGQADWAKFKSDYSRPDVGAAYPGYGDKHGMKTTFEVFGGDTTVCVIARNIGTGADKEFGCTTVAVETASPYGGSSVGEVPGGIHLEGWTLDTDTVAPLAVHVYIDGVGAAYLADAYRPDVGRVFPGFGDKHGIDLLLPTSVGTHEVCAYGINVGMGFNSLLGCHTVTVSSTADPVGVLESITAVPGGIRAVGWAIDPETKEPIQVHLYRGGVGTAIAASLSRPDVAADYPSFGANHGFDSVIGAPAGSSQICAYAINVGWGTNTVLDCRTVTVLSGSPFGGIDASVGSGTLRVRGWTIDPDTTASIPVHIYVDGQGQAVSANASRPDVGNVYPGYGSAHGIDSTLSVGAGRHSVCAYAINSGLGANALLGCITVNVPDSSPFGGTDVIVDGSNARVRGWTIDPDTTAPIDVHIYVDGRGAAVSKAGVSRPDVAAAYPGFGELHGIDTTVPLTPGSHQLCSYAINVGPGSNTLLGCQSVSIR